MAQAPPAPAGSHVATPERLESTRQAHFVTPGKVAMWLFLATEVMFFTGLIGTYIVLRAGSPSTAYSNLYPPATKLDGLTDTMGIRIEDGGPNVAKVAALALPQFARYNPNGVPDPKAIEHDVEHMIETGHAVVPGMDPDEAKELAAQLKAAGAKVELEPLVTHQWPKPYDHATNPLSIDLTAANTFILICSSVTLVFALSAVQRGNQRRLVHFLLATLLFGGIFLGVQVFEYYQLMIGHIYSPGIGRTGHFRPDASLFASCFFTMTGFHGAHVAGGLVLLSLITFQAWRGRYTRNHHSSLELAGLYWHFVDLVWILLFTVVYLI